MEGHLKGRQLGVDTIGYFRKDEYQKELTAEEKLEKLWGVLVPDPTDHSVEPK